ncbi:hypothetical protein SH580_15285 [Coraliomargarita algicola]|uniref:PEP-CTERM sorting domain-containing protein n=1 Tax=Coraliomargarita algicola TaxID=3092156 RepID=A0ABZ0RIG7_9BACT|nr:hypothetical protein [Coraliomargarita sp. J2-16]WPJ94795.1 hypothetical protein SH580_15285 [Coraliomargarita sp. J2-16]
MNRILPLAIASTLLATTSNASINIYGFEALTESDLDGQDNWTTTLYNTSNDVQVVAGASADGSKALQFTQSGAGVGVDGSRLNDSNYSLPDFDGIDHATIDFSFHTPYWGGEFGLGFDYNNDDIIENNSNELAFNLYSKGQNDTLIFKDHLGTETSTALSGLSVTGAWINYRLDIDFTANSGTGSVSVSFQDPLAPESAYMSIANLQNINLNLSNVALNASNPANWEGMFFHFEGSTGGLDNVSAVPELSSYALILGGLVCIPPMLKRRRKN